MKLRNLRKLSESLGLFWESRRLRACKMKVEETSMKAKMEYLLTSITTSTLVTACTQSTSNTAIVLQQLHPLQMLRKTNHFTRQGLCLYDERQQQL